MGCVAKLLEIVGIVSKSDSSRSAAMAVAVECLESLQSSLLHLASTLRHAERNRLEGADKLLDYCSLPLLLALGCGPGARSNQADGKSSQVPSAVLASNASPIGRLRSIAHHMNTAASSLVMSRCLQVEELIISTLQCLLSCIGINPWVAGGTASDSLLVSMLVLARPPVRHAATAGSSSSATAGDEGAVKPAHSPQGQIQSLDETELRQTAMDLAMRLLRDLTRAGGASSGHKEGLLGQLSGTHTLRRLVEKSDHKAWNLWSHTEDQGPHLDDSQDMPQARVPASAWALGNTGVEDAAQDDATGCWWLPAPAVQQLPLPRCLLDQSVLGPALAFAMDQIHAVSGEVGGGASDGDSAPAQIPAAQVRKAVRFVHMSVVALAGRLGAETAKPPADGAIRQLIAPHPRRLWGLVPGLASALIGLLDSVVMGRRRQQHSNSSDELAEARLRGTGGMESALAEEAAGALSALLVCSLGDDNAVVYAFDPKDAEGASTMASQARTNLLGPVLRALVQLSQGRTPRLQAASLPLLQMLLVQCPRSLLGLWKKYSELAESHSGTGSASGSAVALLTDALDSRDMDRRSNALLAVIEVVNSTIQLGTNRSSLGEAPRLLSLGAEAIARLSVGVLRRLPGEQRMQAERTFKYAEARMGELVLARIDSLQQALASGQSDDAVAGQLRLLRSSCQLAGTGLAADKTLDGAPEVAALLSVCGRILQRSWKGDQSASNSITPSSGIEGLAEGHSFVVQPLLLDSQAPRGASTILPDRDLRQKSRELTSTTDLDTVDGISADILRMFGGRLESSEDTSTLQSCIKHVLQKASTVARQAIRETASDGVSPSNLAQMLYQCAANVQVAALVLQGAAERRTQNTKDLDKAGHPTQASYPSERLFQRILKDAIQSPAEAHIGLEPTVDVKQSALFLACWCGSGAWGTAHAVGRAWQQRASAVSQNIPPVVMTACQVLVKHTVDAWGSASKYIDDEQRSLFRPIWLPQLLGVAAGTQGSSSLVLHAATRAISLEGRVAPGDFECTGEEISSESLRRALVLHSSVILDTIGSALRLDRSEKTLAWQGDAAQSQGLWLRFGAAAASSMVTRATFDDSTSSGASTAGPAPSLQARLRAAATAGSVASFVLQSMLVARGSAESDTPIGVAKSMVDDAGVGLQRCSGGSSHSVLRHTAIASMLRVVHAGAKYAATMTSIETDAEQNESLPAASLLDDVWASALGRGKADDCTDWDDEEWPRIGVESAWAIHRSVESASCPPKPPTFVASSNAGRKLAVACIRISRACLENTSLRVAATAADALVAGLTVLRGSPVILLPQLAQSWSQLSSLAQRSAHVELRIKSVGCLTDGMCIAAAGGDFLRSRIREELWPTLVEGVVEGTARMDLARSSEGGAASRHSGLPTVVLRALMWSTDEQSQVSVLADQVQALRRRVRGSGASSRLRLGLECALCIAMLCGPAYRHGNRGYAGPDADASEEDGLDDEDQDPASKTLPIAAAMQRRQQEAAEDARRVMQGDEAASEINEYMHVWELGPGAKPHDVATATGMRFGLAPLPMQGVSAPGGEEEKATAETESSPGVGEIAATPSCSAGVGPSSPEARPSEEKKMNTPSATWEQAPLQSPAIVQEASLLACAMARQSLRAVGPHKDLCLEVSVCVLRAVGRGLSPASVWVQAIEDALQIATPLSDEAAPQKPASFGSDLSAARELWGGEREVVPPHESKPEPYTAWTGRQVIQRMESRSFDELLHEATGGNASQVSTIVQFTGLSAATQDFHQADIATSGGRPEFRSPAPDGHEAKQKTQDLQAATALVQAGSATASTQLLAIERRRQRRVDRSLRDKQLAVLDDSSLLLPGAALDKENDEAGAGTTTLSGGKLAVAPGLTVRSVRYIGGGAKSAASSALTALEASQGSSEEASWRQRTSNGAREEERHTARLAAVQVRAGGPGAAAQGRASAALQRMVTRTLQ